MEPVSQVIGASASSAFVSYFLPFLLFGGGVAILITLLKKNPQKAVMGCGTLCLVAFLLGVVITVVEFIQAHSTVFFVLTIVLFFVCLVLFMVYTPPSPPKIKNEYIPNDDKDNPFYEGPR